MNINKSFWRGGGPPTLLARPREFSSLRTSSQIFVFLAAGGIVLLLYSYSFWQWFQEEKASSDSSFRVVSALKGSGNESPFMKEEFISPPGDLQVHAASMTELKDGTLAAVWYGGKYEGSKDTLIYFTYRERKEEGEWSVPRGIVGRDSASKELGRYIKKIGNPVIFTDLNDRLRLIYVTVSVGGWSGSSLNMTGSHDRGETWSPAHRLTLSPFLNISELVRCNPTALSEGGFVVPIYHECIGTFSELLWFRPDPDGETYRYFKTRLTWGKQFIQPSVVPMTRDKAAVFYRAHRGMKRIGVSIIDASGKTTSSLLYTGLPNPDAGINGLLLSGGSILVAYNHHEKTRENLSLAVFSPDLRHWIRAAVLEDSPGDEFSYPYMLASRDGRVHLLYTWKRERIKHVVFNRAWLKERVTEEFLPDEAGEPAKVAPAVSALPREVYRSGVTYIFSFFFPFLIVLWFLQAILRLLGLSAQGWKTTGILTVLSALAVVVPVEGFPLARWMICLNANFSVPLTAFVLHRVREKASGMALLDKKALTGIWIFGGIAGTVLYPAAMGLGRFDSYSLGWGFSVFFVCMFGLTMALLYRGNRFGIVLVFCIAAFHLHLLESSNLWDYFVDPFFTIAAVYNIGKRVFSRGIVSKHVVRESS
jgi:predicted neuraminidase